MPRGVPKAKFQGPVTAFEQDDGSVVLGTDPAVLVEELVEGEGRFAMEYCPRDGRGVWLFPEEGEPVLAYWKLTRKCVGRTWVPYGKFCIWRGSEDIAFEPVSWSEWE